MQLPGAGFGPKHHEYKLRAKDVGTNLSNYSSVVTIRSGAGAQKYGPNIVSAAPNEYSLGQNFPNPFNPSTSIEYALSEPSTVTIKVYNQVGKEIETIVNKEQPEGHYTVPFDASRLASGVYFYSITAGKFSLTKKMMLMK